MFMNNEQELKDLLKKLDEKALIPDEMIDDMDFYQLAYYMQTLNALDSLSEENTEGDEDDE